MSDVEANEVKCRHLQMVLTSEEEEQKGIQSEYSSDSYSTA